MKIVETAKQEQNLYLRSVFSRTEKKSERNEKLTVE